MRLLALSLGLCTALVAQAPDDVARALKAFSHEGALKAEIHAEFNETLQGEKGAPAKGAAVVSLEVLRDGTGLDARWIGKDLEAAKHETEGRELDPRQPAPLRALMSEMEPARIDHLLHQDEVLLGLLAKAKSAGAHEERQGDRAVTCLEFDYAPRVPARLRRVKAASGHLKLWMDPATGLPLRSELEEHWAGKAGRIAPLEKGDHAVTTTYAVVRGWLVAQERETSDHADDYYTRTDARLRLVLHL